MNRKSASEPVSKISSTASPTMSSRKRPSSSQKTSILKSAFAPSQFQLHLFASIIQTFDSHQLRVHDTASGRLTCRHDSHPGTKITCLEWGYYGAAYWEQRRSHPKKKRRRAQNNTEAVVIAYGTDAADICMFSPFEGKVVATLSGAHDNDVRDFKFAGSDYLQGWSLGSDGKLVQWDLTAQQQMRSIALPDPEVHLMASSTLDSPHILCASSTPFMIDLHSTTDYRIDRYDSFKGEVHTLLRSPPSNSPASNFFIAADAGRYLNVYDIDQKRLSHTLVTGSGVVGVDLSRLSDEYPGVLNKQLLCAVTKDGVVELFLQPFAELKQVNGGLAGSRNPRPRTRKASAVVRLVSEHQGVGQPGSAVTPVFTASLQGPDLILASVENGVELAFQKLRWQDEGNGNLLFAGMKAVTKKSTSSLGPNSVHGVKDRRSTQVDESKTVVVNGTAGGVDAIEISSSESDEDEDDDVSAPDEAQTANEAVADSEENEENDDDDDENDAPSDQDMVQPASDNVAQSDDEEMEDAEEPSFGKLLAARHPNEISVSSALPGTTLTPGIDGLNSLPVIPSGMSLGTVLTQALRTNDQSLLEACLHTLDADLVKNTIQRLDSSLAGSLLSKLADRLASRPGRYSHLITWVQWTCVAHGGSIATQLDVTTKLRTLYSVLSQRSKTLDSLLLLKGKLDMLNAQLDYRRQLTAQRSTRDDQDEPGLIYIEGADNWDSEKDDSSDDNLTRRRKRVKRPSKVKRPDLDDLLANGEADTDEEDGEDILLENGGYESGDDAEAGEEGLEEDNEPDTLLHGSRRALVEDEAEVESAAESDSASDDNVDGDLSTGGESSSDVDSDGDHSDDQEEDSEMDSFINDGSISVESDEDDVHLKGDGSSDGHGQD